MMKALAYSFKIWVTALAFGSTIYYLLQLVEEPETRKYAGVGNLFIFIQNVFLYAFIFSLPCFLLLIISVALVNVTPLTIPVKKIMLTAISILLTLLPFYYIEGGGHWGQQAIMYAESYGSIIVAGIWIYKLEPIERPDSEFVEEEI
jgi:hypothetical protein